jgi:hypothetical protein
MEWGVEEWVAALSALIAIASFAFNWAVVSRQNTLQFETLKAQMDAETLNWAHEAIDLVSQAVGIARGRGAIYAPDEVRRLALETSQKLSSIADRGRLFFPNDTPDDHGQEKEGAFKGYRPPILDAVVFSCSLLELMKHDDPEPDKETADSLIKLRRLLVSEVQNAIDPRRRTAMLKQLAIGRMDDTKSSFRVAAELGEALNKRYPGFLIEPRDEAWIAKREAGARRT